MKRKQPEPERTVRVNCDMCGPRSMPLATLRVRCCVENRDDATYTFRCPYCDHITVRRITRPVRELLFDHPWIDVDWWHLPLELSEPKLHPPLTEDDVLDFTRELNAL